MLDANVATFSSGFRLRSWQRTAAGIAHCTGALQFARDAAKMQPVADKNSAVGERFLMCMNWIKRNGGWRWIGWCAVLTALMAVCARAESFSEILTEATQAAQRGDLPAALKLYAQAESLASTNAADWCAVSRGYSEAMSLTNSTPAKINLLDRASSCALRAIRLAPQAAAAHATVAVCYAKRCNFAGIREQVNYSRLFKLEAEKAIALDPRQDVAFYLLGRWNYEVAHVGLLARTYVRVVYGGLPQASNEAAIENYQKAIALAPDSVLYHAGLATVYQATANRTAAIVEWKKCQTLRPTNSEDRDAQREAAKKLAELGQ
jgi:tetratricopeptide (TPR) repeat protein